MTIEHGAQERVRSAVHGNRNTGFALPGRGGLTRIAAAGLNSLRGLREGLRTEAAVKQEVALALVALPLSFFVATNVWVWLAWWRACSSC